MKNLMLLNVREKLSNDIWVCKYKITDATTLHWVVTLF